MKSDNVEERNYFFFLVSDFSFENIFSGENKGS